MSRYGNKWFNPAQIFAQFTTTGEKEELAVGEKRDLHGDDVDGCGRGGKTDTNRRDIQITESAEVSLAPDKATVSIVCASSKDNVEDVKTSVNRRVDYILQTLKSYRIKENAYKVNRILSRTDKVYRYEVEVLIEFTDFTKCEEISNLLVEKLDETVQVSPPVFYVSPSKLESLRGQACVSAVRNAKNKALQVVQMFNQLLGPPITIREEHFEEYVGSTSNEPALHAEDADKHIQSFHEKICQATVTVCVKVFVVFEIKEKTKVHKRKK